MIMEKSIYCDTALQNYLDNYSYYDNTINDTCMHTEFLFFSRAARILAPVSVSGQYQNILMISESVKYIIQVPILSFYSLFKFCSYTQYECIIRMYM